MKIVETAFDLARKAISEKIIKRKGVVKDKEWASLSRLVESFHDARNGYFLVKDRSKKWRKIFIGKMKKNAKKLFQMRDLIRILDEGTPEWESYVYKVFQKTVGVNTLHDLHQLRKTLPSKHEMSLRVERIIVAIEGPKKKKKRKK